MGALVLHNVSKTFGHTHALRAIDFAVDDSELAVILGPSGCGKSTLLRIIAGLEDASAGEIEIGGRRVTDLPPAKRRIAMVFQSYALYPHMSVYDNMAFGLKLAGADRDGIRRRVRDAARLLQLEAHLDRKPRTLSGGQRQRVAMGRALVRDPDVFLFDEPLSNLDATLRVDLRLEISRLQRQLGATMVYVTHDQTEAMTLADRIVVMKDGAIEQIGAPLEIYRNPRNVFVAGFIGSPRMNLIRGRVEKIAPDRATVSLPSGTRLTVPVRECEIAVGDWVTVGIRPEHLRIGSDGGARFNGSVATVEALGSMAFVHVSVGNETTLVVREESDPRMRIGERVPVAVDAHRCHVFDRSGIALSRPARDGPGPGHEAVPATDS